MKNLIAASAVGFGRPLTMTTDIAIDIAMGVLAGSRIAKGAGNDGVY